jgi:hypothetical protein
MDEDHMGQSARSSLAGLAILIFLTPPYVTFCQYDQQSRGLIFVCITGVFLMALYVRRDLVRKGSFWISMITMYSLHLVFIFSIKIPDAIPGFIMFPISIGDLYLVFFIISLIEKRVGGASDV